jgi:hypothetical protein
MAKSMKEEGEMPVPRLPQLEKNEGDEEGEGVHPPGT